MVCKRSTCDWTLFHCSFVYMDYMQSILDLQDLFGLMRAKINGQPPC